MTENATTNLPSIAVPTKRWKTTVAEWLATPAPLHEDGYRLREIPRWSTWSAGLVIVAGVLHLAMLPMHLADARGTGFYFLGIGAGQVVWGCLFLLKPTPRLARFGLVVLTGAPVGLWLLTRLFRSPWGVGPEEMDFTSVATVLLEVGASLILVFARLGKSVDAETPTGRVVIGLLVLGLLVGGASYGAAMAAEATIPWLGEAESSHHAEPETAFPDEPAAPDHASEPHGHG